MMKIATLPHDTFSHLAAKKYLAETGLQGEFLYQKTITNVFEELAAQNCDIGVVPVENSSQGFVPLTQDGLKEFSVSIIDELILPVELSFFSKVERLQIKQIFVHDVAKNQCKKFLSEYSYAEIAPADSNMDAFDKLNANSDCAAVVPSHIFEANEKKYKFCVRDITDNSDNHTRFLVLKKSDEAEK